MNIRGRKISVVTISLVALAMVLSFALAAVVSTHSVSNTVTITQGDFGVFSDAACTQPLTSLSWGQLGNGQWQTQTFYLLNNGANPIYVWWNTPDISSGLYIQMSNPVASPFPSPDPLPSPSSSPSPMNGFWYPSSMYKIALQPNQPVQVQAWLNSNGVSVGSYSWSLAFTGEDSP